MSWRPTLPAAALAALLIAAPALAQDRTPVQRQTLTELAYVLGQSHALRQVCMGASDQFWRERMTRLVRNEAPDPAFDTRLRDSFNAGFSQAQAQYTACGPESRAAEARSANRGKALSSTLARATPDDLSAR